MIIFEDIKYMDVEASCSNTRLIVEIGNNINNDVCTNVSNIDLTRENVLKLKEKIEEFLEQTNE